MNLISVLPHTQVNRERSTSTSSDVLVGDHAHLANLDGPNVRVGAQTSSLYPRGHGCSTFLCGDDDRGNDGEANDGQGHRSNQHAEGNNSQGYGSNQHAEGNDGQHNEPQSERSTTSAGGRHSQHDGDVELDQFNHHSPRESQHGLGFNPTTRNALNNESGQSYPASVAPSLSTGRSATPSDHGAPHTPIF
ncbi:hypothetical protein C8R42DRAFT_346692 [Lentinula raphanica]|nr:hypothetical protein C8R42DRAFT_346692 [Lentinula raphanica]